MTSTPKRIATSPADKMSNYKKPCNSGNAPIVPSVPNTAISTDKPQAVSDQGSLVKFEVLGINSAKYYGVLSELEILYIWEKVLGRSRNEIFAMSYARSLTRNFRVTIKLNQVTETHLIYPEPNFEFCRSKPDAGPDGDYDVLHCRFLGYDPIKPAELGQLTRITVKTNDFTVPKDLIVQWLALYGSVSVNHDYERNSVGIRTDILETEIALREHIPDYLPIGGRKVLISYPGIPRSCNNCYGLGHMKRACRSKKVDWIDRVAEFKNREGVTDEMLGGWIAILEQRK
jgi:hypothetical protein